VAARAGRRGFLLPAFVGVATLALYLPGSGRALDYDSAQSVGSFIRTPSLLDPLRRQTQFNNHPAFSLAEHVVYTVTGSSDEAILRLLPIVFSALTTVAVVAAVQRYVGWLPATCAGLVVATNPAVLILGRAVRGYSLLVLCATVASIALWRLLQRDGEERRWSIAYVVATAAGIATHLYMLPVVVGHMVVVAVRRPGVGRWGPRWLLAGGFGSVFYAAMIDEFIESRGAGGRPFQARFPLELAEVAVGSGLGALCISAVALAGAWVQLRDRRELLAAIGAVALVIAASWLLWRPGLLAPRFHVWAIPGVAALAAAAVARFRVAAIVVITGAILNAASVRDRYTADENALPELAAILDEAHAAGDRGCVVNRSILPMLAYADGFAHVVRADDLARCDVVVVPFPSLDEDLVEAAREVFPRQRSVPSGGENGLVLSGVRP
jgi:hypothetical protein